MSVPVDRLCLKDIVEEDQILPDQIELKVDFKMTHCKNEIEKDVILITQKKLADVTIIKRNMQIEN